MTSYTVDSECPVCGEDLEVNVDIEGFGPYDDATLITEMICPHCKAVLRIKSTIEVEITT